MVVWPNGDCDINSVEPNSWHVRVQTLCSKSVVSYYMEVLMLIIVYIHDSLAYNLWMGLYTFIYVCVDSS